MTVLAMDLVICGLVFYLSKRDSEQSYAAESLFFYVWNPVSAMAALSQEKNRMVVISSKTMGEGNDELGATLLKGFIYALTQQDELPDQMLFYNGGAFLTCEGSQSLEDLKMLEEQGVEIRTCGTCLNFYGISDKLQVGEVTNMYDIAERMTKADRIIKP